MRLVALLRGINVGTGRTLAMADVRAAFEAAGATSVATYIQSGNVVFEYGKRATAPLVADLERRLAQAAGFAVPVVLRGATEWAAVLRACPFRGAPPEHLHVLFARAKLPADALAALDLARFEPEQVALGAREAYLCLPNGVGRSKLFALVARQPGLVDATARNWRTVLRLQELVAGP